MKRAERVEELIREEISRILRNKVSDPRIGFVSITEVKITPDFKNAAVYVSILGEESQKKEAMNGLYSATSFIRGELGRCLTMRTTPGIRFFQDDSIERGSRVLQIISKLDHEKEENTGKNKKGDKGR